MFLSNYHYMKLSIGITTSISLALSICVMFLLFMESVNGAQFLNFTFLFVFFAAATAAEVFATVINSFN